MVKLKMKPVEMGAYVLGAVGALTWGTDKVLGFNGIDMVISAVGLAGYAIFVYGAVGLAGAWALYKIWY